MTPETFLLVMWASAFITAAAIAYGIIHDGGYDEDQA